MLCGGRLTDDRDCIGKAAGVARRAAMNGGNRGLLRTTASAAVGHHVVSMLDICLCV